MIALTCEYLGFSVGAKTILKGVSFSLNEGDKMGIVGVNGAGKSTLLRMIAGTCEPSEGAVYLRKSATLEMLNQNDMVEEEKTPYEVLLSSCTELGDAEKRLEELSSRMVTGDEEASLCYHSLHERFLELGGYEYKGRIKGILRSLGFSEEQMNTPSGILSGGQKTRLALARILYKSPDILILDEPTNHLDTATLGWLEDYLRNYRKTVLVVSHDRYFLDRVVQKVLDIEWGSAKLYTGNYSSFKEQKAKNREVQEHHFRNQQKEIERIEAYIALQKRWNRERNIIAAESRQKMLDRMERIERPNEDPRNIRLTFRAGIESGNDVLKARGLSKSFSAKNLFTDLSFDVKKGDRLLIIGHNGCGKSTLMKVLAGRLSPDSGSCDYGYNLTVGYYDQENQNLNPSNTVLDELWNLSPTMIQQKVRSALALFNFTGEDVQKTVSVLSGGERARLTFAKLMLKENNLLLLDEPTNHLDIASKEVLEEALADYDGTVLCVSHDRYFISRLANHILDFDGAGGVPAFCEGTYEEYLRYKKRQEENASEKTEGAEEEFSDRKKQYLENKKNQSEFRKLRTRLERAKAEAEAAEKKLEEFSLEEEGCCSDYVRLSEIGALREKTENALLELYGEIEDLENKLK